MEMARRVITGRISLLQRLDYAIAQVCYHEKRRDNVSDHERYL